ncbi:MAG: hypothetical protein AMJ84_05445 [Acidithiobacillales bacterium SM23_46]|nr:MAG: hypothetical protein AMJ84_05445 [Acidithiobacillales bacterium SM23_46]KPL27972.1 MAG: hypothetical protein AMJ72_05910 [Acidithiobacillales bacterium SM1_46]
MNLGKQIKITTALDYAEAAASRNGAVLDMAGWDGVIGVVKHAAIATGAAGDIHWEQGEDSNLNDAADLAGTKIAVADDDDDQVFVSELYKPRERYVRLVVTKDASHNQAESAIYIQYRGRKQPVSKAGADEYELHISPAEGTK